MKGVIYRYNSPSGKIYVGQTMILERKRINKHKFGVYKEMQYAVWECDSQVWMGNYQGNIRSN